MTELRVTRREWHFFAEFEPGEVPDRQKRWTSITYRPTSLSLRLYAQGADIPRFSEAKFIGPRVNKAGLGVTVFEELHGVANMPDWAIRLFDQAVRMINSGSA